MNQTLMRIVLDSILFLALSDEDVVDADIAVNQMEQIAENLKQLSAVEQSLFLSYIEQQAKEILQSGDQEKHDFLESLPENLGFSQ